MQPTLRLGLCAALVMGLTATAAARPITYVAEPTTCDAIVPTVNHELGNPGVAGPAGSFPPDQAINSVSTFDDRTPCPTVPDDPAVPNRVVSITNLTGKSWTDLWFVADELNSFTNVDAIVADTTPDAAPGSPVVLSHGFRIDNVGVNQPLFAESMAPNLVFEPGETWLFIVQDWLPVIDDPALLGSIGFSGRSPLPNSHASILALESDDISGPATLLAFGSALLGFAFLRRRRRV